MKNIHLLLCYRISIINDSLLTEREKEITNAHVKRTERRRVRKIRRRGIEIIRFIPCFLFYYYYFFIWQMSDDVAKTENAPLNHCDLFGDWLKMTAVFVPTKHPLDHFWRFLNNLNTLALVDTCLVFLRFFHFFFFLTASSSSFFALSFHRISTRSSPFSFSLFFLYFSRKFAWSENWKLIFTP